MAAGSFSSRDAGGHGVSIKGSTNPGYTQIPHTHGSYVPKKRGR